ncbi:response regulator transcription factor [Terribacillus sp. FSL K6-0262]|uniref:response regulator transcription factor n=1 Tax=Terribacillus TaxID=459532 RepID=UPI0030ED82B6
MDTKGLCRTLIVDDEILIRQGIKHYLDWEKEGFTIVGEASNGREALELIEKLDPHIVVTDVVMPIMDGEALIRIVKEKYPHIGLIVLSSFSEFDYVRGAFQNGVIDYILKPKLNAEVLLQALRLAAGQLEDFHLSTGEHDKTWKEKLLRLFEGVDTSFHEEIAAYFPSKHFQVVSIRQEASQDAGSIRNTAMKNGSFFPIISGADNEISLWNGEEILDENAFPDVPASACICVTRPFDDILELKEKQKELEQLESYRFYFPDKGYLSEASLPLDTAEECEFEMDGFIEACKRDDFQEAFRHVQEHMERSAKNYKQDIAEYKAFLNNVMFNLIVLLGNGKYQTELLEKRKYDYFQRVVQAEDIYKANKTIASFLKEVECLVKSEGGQGHMRKLTAYIKEHYHEALSLSDIANHFHFSPSYLSNYFSAHSREGFSGYLNRVRIEAAINLLRQNDIPISKISEQVGFSDHSYFCRVFKKQTGYSPSQYRRKRMMS